MSKGPEIIAVGGGKGGVGKSFISAGLATSLARRGYDTVVIDLDLGGANLHTLLGIRYPETGIGDYIYRPHSRDLLDYVTETDIKGLKLISGYGFIPGIANLNYFQKLKIIRAVSRLENDYIILDLGAGTSYNVVDFFSMTESGVIVTNAEPTAVLNAYEFIKNVLFRMIEKNFSKNRELLALIRNFKKPEDHGDCAPAMEHLIAKIAAIDTEGAAAIRDICRKFTPALVINMASGSVDSLSEKLKAICRQFLSIDVGVLDAVPADEDARACLLRMKHVIVENPDAPSSRALCDIAEKFLNGGIAVGRQASEVADGGSDAAGERLISGHREDMELAALISDFFSDLPAWEGADETSSESGSTLQPHQCLDLDIRVDDQLTLPRFMPFEDMLDEESVSVPPSGVLARIAAIADAEDALLAIASQDQLHAESREVGKKWIQCGYSLLASHQQQSAFKAFMRAYRLIPDSLPAAVSAGAAHIAGNEPLEAVKLLENALEIHEDHPLLMYNLAAAAFKLGQFQKCVELVSRLSASNELDGNGMVLGAQAAFRLGDFSLASRFMTSMNGSCPWQPEMLAWNRGVVLFKLEKFDQAVRFFDKVLKSNPGDSEALAARGAAMWRLQEIDAALADFNQAVQLKNSDVGFRAARGTAAFHAGLLDRAIGDIEVIARLRPDNVKFRALLEAIQAQLGT